MSGSLALSEGDGMPSQYVEYADIATKAAVSPVTRVKYSIHLLLGITAPHGPIYSLSGRELEALREYLEKAL